MQYSHHLIGAFYNMYMYMVPLAGHCVKGWALKEL
jgi:hypothetical protein